MAWECRYCLKEFKSERNFMKHRCSEMKKSEILESIDGKSAYALYSLWMKAYKRKAPDIQTFGTSRYFNTFVKFAKYVKKLNIPDVKKFIQLMKDRDISPILWMRDECYSIYLEWHDRKSTPFEQALITIKTISDIAEAGNIDESEIFEVLKPNEIIQLIRLRKLSPWILLCSKKFKEFLNKISEAEKQELVTLIGFNYWSEKMKQYPDVVEHMKLFAKELGI